ncbi:MAG: translocase FtsK protein [Candidatus Uhrbacteria bacterium GW2011_GWE2_45_35]|uniref:Translocase FtsK protein n=2 Tax=Candidatus Uhriibacteriota TaxID=1752732 RepID=A0A0G1LRI9_9BACT|nr:MAG: translocase FtsK protein [Candidatus Uhrbacteria bacterium GW2011_GWF2_44_350]KKU07922.1 MAG: translocase FtsK protein [Candidatus Uhrbacteria bacterium GW2011_GWE2_45_35]HBR80410.1 cell division protein FtsK [Candidatus Uhrbacteria bacterium]HCU32021.1 cell division protein FtsK [Candidatus Uhrbacteria bacterium]
MSRKKKHKYRSEPKKFELPELNPETKRGVAVIFLFAAAALLLLAFFQIAGTIGLVLDELMAKGFGFDRVLIPILFIVIGFSLLFPERSKLGTWNYLGLLFFFLSFNGLVNLFWNDSLNPGLEKLMETGGLVGQALGTTLQNISSFWGAFLMLTAMLLISVLLTLNTSLRKVIGLHRHLTGWFGAMIHNRRNAALMREIDPEVEEVEEIEDFSEDDIEEVDEEETKKAFRTSSLTPAVVPPTEKVLTTRQHRKVTLPIDLLEYRSMKVNSGDTERNKEIIRRTFEQFSILVEMGEISVGPTIAQYTLRPSEGVKLSRIVALQNDLALALAAHPIRIEAPIPGKSLVGIEVPNQTIATVSLRELLESKPFKSRSGALSIALGKDVTGKVWVSPLEKMPHMLIAGATGSGKSVCINTLIVSLLYTNSPDDLKMILVDPKRVELTAYEGIPHLLIPPITKVDDTVNALKWTVREMDRRLDLLSKLGARDIASYNQRVEEKMPRIVVFIDELADLMSTSGHEVEGAVVRIAQMARAVGIHLVLATQRPSVDVITGLIKANFPSRIAFAVASQTDSRTILDCAGAEKLLGRGDMLFTSAELSKPVRLQGAYVSEAEVGRIVEYLKREEIPDYNYAILEKEKTGSIFDGAASDDNDPMLDEAAGIVIQAGRASTSLLQRRLKIGYGRAARILDILEENGVIGPPDGSRPREILSTVWPITSGGTNDNEFAERKEFLNIEEVLEVPAEKEEIPTEEVEKTNVIITEEPDDKEMTEEDFLNAQEGNYLDEK